jgi:hypothetical protein
MWSVRLQFEHTKRFQVPLIQHVYCVAGLRASPKRLPANSHVNVEVLTQEYFFDPDASNQAAG